MNYYVKTHPEHQSKAGKRGGAVTAEKYPGQMRNAYSILTPVLRRENKKFHDLAVNAKAESLKQDGFLIIFQDGLKHERPDIIAYKDGTVYMLDVKTKKRIIRMVEEGTITLNGEASRSGSGELKRPLMTDVDPKKEFDSVDISLTTRYAPVVLNGECVAQITGLATT